MARSTTKQPAKPKRGAKSQIIGDGVDYSRYSSHSQKDLSIEQQIAKNEELASTGSGWLSTTVTAQSPAAPTSAKTSSG